TRRRIASAKADWALSDRGFAALSGIRDQEGEMVNLVVEERGGEGNEVDEPDLLADEFALIDAVLERSERLISNMTKGDGRSASASRGLMVGDLMIRDPDWDEAERLSQWRSVEMSVQDMP